MITRCACVLHTYRMSVAGSPVARRGIPVDLTLHKERAHCGRAVISQGQRQSNNYKATITRTAGSNAQLSTTELRLNNYDYRARLCPGLRRTAVATAAERLPVCACRARQTANWMSRQIQVNSRGDCDGVWLPRQTSVALAAGRKQNAAQRSDRQPEPLAANTPVSRARPSPPASWRGSRDYLYPGIAGDGAELTSAHIE